MGLVWENVRFHGVFYGSLGVVKSCRIIGRWFGALNVLIHSIFAAALPNRLFQPAWPPNALRKQRMIVVCDILIIDREVIER